MEKNYKLSNGNYFHFHTNEDGYYYEIYDNKGIEIDGGLLEYSEDDDKKTLDDIRKDLADFTDIAELTNEILEEVTQEFIDNLEDSNINKLEEIYAVIYEWFDNYEGENNVELFNTREKAQKRFNEIKTEIKTEYGYDTFTTNPNYFLGYNDGCYTEKHDEVRIEKLEVK